MKPDPAIDEIRRVRHEMSAEIDHDPRRLLEYYAEIQDRCRDRLVDYGGESTAAPGLGDDTASPDTPSTTT